MRECKNLFKMTSKKRNSTDVTVTRFNKTGHRTLSINGSVKVSRDFCRSNRTPGALRDIGDSFLSFFPSLFKQNHNSRIYSYSLPETWANCKYFCVWFSFTYTLNGLADTDQAIETVFEKVDYLSENISAYNASLQEEQASSP